MSNIVRIPVTFAITDPLDVFTRCRQKMFAAFNELAATGISDADLAEEIRLTESVMSQFAELRNA